MAATDARTSASMPMAHGSMSIFPLRKKSLVLSIAINSFSDALDRLWTSEPFRYPILRSGHRVNDCS
jgi:hypothetical protein